MQKRGIRIIQTLILVAFISLSHLAWSQGNLPVIPYPNFVKTMPGELHLTDKTTILVEVESQKVARDLKAYLEKEKGLILAEGKGNVQITFDKDETLSKEGYELSIDKDGVQIVASGVSGWFYAIETLKQLLPDELTDRRSLTLPCLLIKDAPRFSWRAFMLDESRHFRGMSGVKQLLDEMARLKMNVFHWHLVDDQGWRIEIKKYPLLTEVGGRRESTQVGPKRYDSPIQTGEPHAGYYTQDEIREIVKYAAERQITVVPEIEMPGHASAAIAAYPWLGASKEEIEVPTTFGVFYNVYDVSDPRVIQFIKDVLDEVIELFPSKVIHVGGDEVKYDQWKQSSTIQAYMAEKGLSTPAELQVYFTNSISAYLQSKGRRMMGWNEILGLNLHHFQDQSDTKSEQKLARESVVHFWKGDLTMATEAASSDYDIVNSLHSNTYLNYAYRNIPLKMAYQYNPVPDGLDPLYEHKVIGLGCQMWTEWAPSIGQLHYQVFPRIAAYAEVGWTRISQKDYSTFLNNLDRYARGWEERGIYFAPIPLAEAIEESN